MNKRIATILTAASMIWLGNLNGEAGEFGLEAVGARAGFSVNPGTRGDMFQAEALGNVQLPWGWDLGKEWSLRPRMDLSAGGLTGMGDQSFVGTVGPTVVLERNRFPVELVAGSSPTFLSRSSFGGWDVGTWFQFTSHAGLTFALSSRWELSYRFQHMSNANISEHNPGINLHMFSIAYRLKPR